MTAFHYRNTKAAKLTPGQVAEMKTLYAEGWTQSALCRKFGMSVGQVGRIVRGESWAAIRPEPTDEEIRLSQEKFMREYERMKVPAREEQVLKEAMTAPSAKIAEQAAALGARVRSPLDEEGDGNE